MVRVSIILAVEFSPRQYVIWALLLFGGCVSLHGSNELCVLFYIFNCSIVAGNISKLASNVNYNINKNNYFSAKFLIQSMSHSVLLYIA